MSKISPSCPPTGVLGGNRVELLDALAKSYSITRTIVTFVTIITQIPLLCFFRVLIMFLTTLSCFIYIYL